MKITKEYKGITRKENGDYCISGSIKTCEDIEIELDDRHDRGAMWRNFYEQIPK